MNSLDGSMDSSKLILSKLIWIKVFSFLQFTESYSPQPSAGISPSEILIYTVWGHDDPPVLDSILL